MDRLGGEDPGELDPVGAALSGEPHDLPPVRAGAGALGLAVASFLLLFGYLGAGYGLGSEVEAGSPSDLILLVVMVAALFLAVVSAFWSVRFLLRAFARETPLGRALAVLAAVVLLPTGYLGVLVVLPNPIGVAVLTVLGVGWLLRHPKRRDEGTGTEHPN